MSDLCDPRCVRISLTSISCVACAALIACGPGPGSTAGTTGDASSTGEPTGTAPTTGDDATTEAVPTTGAAASTTLEGTSEPKPAICGDGEIDPGELCDDGDPDESDGCNATCEPVAAIAWTYTHDGDAHKTDAAVGVAVDKTGRIIVVGAETVKNRDGLIIALSPAGEELWRRTYDGLAGLDDYFYDVVLDDAGQIFVAGWEEVTQDNNVPVVRAFDPDGGELWRFAETPANSGYAAVEGLALADGALYSVGGEKGVDGFEFVVRRHDVGTGAAAWRTATRAGWKLADGQAIHATADRLVAVGYVQDNTEIHPLTLVLDPAGAIVSETLQDLPWGFWYDITPIGDAGDLMLVGRTFMPGVIDRDVIIRRVDADFAEQWTHIYEHEVLEDMGNSVAVGANEAVFVAGAVTTASAADGAYDILGARYSGAGALLWTDVTDNPEQHGDDFGNAAAAGPGFFVLAGYETTPGSVDVWVRRYNDG